MCVSYLTITIENGIRIICNSDKTHFMLAQFAYLEMVSDDNRSQSSSICIPINRQHFFTPRDGASGML